MKLLYYCVPVFFMFYGCTSSPSKHSSTLPDSSIVSHDFHTQSNADSLQIEHLDLDISVNFTEHTIVGVAIWKLKNPNHIKFLRLDTDGLTIDSVQTNGKTEVFSLEKPVAHLGSALSIPIKGGDNEVTISYKTSPNARALQWLTPQQTHDKKFPFLYTQSESIYARSWVPAPDGPGIRFTYAARVKVPNELMALMSADNPQQKNDSGIYHFTMDMPIPAYLMALAVGNIAFKEIDNRTGVYAEPQMLDKAAWELVDMGKMVSAAESLYGPYRWGRYDVLILPPGFPIGGMENPKLTFATPTIIAGDRSLVNLIAHELAHNWSGNLVTNETWNDFWLNEGFTVYFERRISEAMNGKSYADMLWELGYQDLVTEVKALGDTNADTHLKLNLAGRDPDDGLNDIAYEKGALFLRLIEINVGRKRFDTFLRQYFDSHAFKTINTEAFLQYLNENLIQGDSELSKKLQIHTWVYGPGIPSNAPRADRERFAIVDAERLKFEKGNDPASLLTAQWTTHEWLHFLRNLPKPLTVAQMSNLDQAFHFTQSHNSEIADLWFVMAIAANYTPAFKEMEHFLSQVGRRKFIEPIYTELMNTEKEPLAKSLYLKYRSNYHPLAQMTLDKIVY
ncbi:MAG: M1 family metallopeptidase [Bacteroidetes bacterium]|nr:M1 family metallopeptidase [Bacteroidota bacterium]